MESKTPWSIFFKCFQNQASPEEIARLNDWLKEDADHIRLLDEVYHVYSVSAPVPSPLEPDTRKAWEKVKQKVTTPSRPVRSLTSRFRYAIASAAVIVIALMISLYINSQIGGNFSRQYSEIFTPMGQKASVVLPDGSLVWLNSGSSLKYRQNFNNREREVILEGEAFFNVKHDRSKRFRVTAGTLHVDVYGTSFNIKNYSNDTRQEITVVEGLVGVSDEEKEIGRLTKDEQASLDKVSGQITLTTADPDLVTSWKNNELVFKNTPLEEVAKYLERWYGVNIMIDDKMKGEHQYTFKVKTESLKEMLEMMKIMTPFDYEINGKDVKIRYNY